MRGLRRGQKQQWGGFIVAMIAAIRRSGDRRPDPRQSQRLVPTGCAPCAAGTRRRAHQRWAGYHRLNLWLLYTALACGVDKVRFICLWNGEDGDGQGGTAHVYNEVKRRTGAGDVVRHARALLMRHAEATTPFGLSLSKPARPATRSGRTQFEFHLAVCKSRLVGAACRRPHYDF